MEKTTKIIIAVVVIIAIVAIIAAVILLKPNKGKESKLEINSAEDLSKLVEKIYEGKEEKIPSSLQTQIVDLSDDMMIQAFTGLTDGNDFEYLVASEPMISSQAYSLVLAKVKDNVNADEVAEKMKEKVDTRKWICVSAEQLYATTSGKVICLVMTEKETAKMINDRFKELAGNVGKEYEKVEEDIELPPEMLVQ